MSRPRRAVLRLGDRVRFDDTVHTVVGLSGTAVRLVTASGAASVVLLPHLLGADGFELLDANPPPPKLVPVGLLEGLPDPVVARARAWERHVVEVEVGLPPDAPEGSRPRPEFDPRRRTRAERVAAKAAELTAAGQPTSRVTVERMRHRYRTQGLWGLVDHRAARQPKPFGRADPRLVAAIAAAVGRETDQSTGTRGRLRRRVEQALIADYGPGAVAMPSPATFYRLVAAIAEGRHTFGSAVTRRSQANRPDGPFGITVATRPGEQVQIDSTPLDVLALLDDGVAGRVELTAAVDVATRTICAAVLRPAGTKAVDAALLLARMLVPEPMRPGWAQALGMSHSCLPHERLTSIDARLAHAAAKPVIVPETIVCDRSKVFLSATFLTACQTLGISVQPAHPRSPTDKGVAERTFGSINSLLTQHVAGYVGRDVTRRGVGEATQAAWTLPQLQDLLDEWIVAGWQPRPHEGLRNPHAPGQVLSPNEMFAVLVAAAGYVPMALAGEDYLELLPACWRSIQDYGVRIGHRTYDGAGLNPYRRQPSGVDGQQGRWEIHYDPYDLSRVWVRDHHAGGWITASWTHLPMVRAPFADFTWRRAREIVAARGHDDTDQTVVARALAELLARAEAGPANATASAGGSADDRRDRRTVARTTAAIRALPIPPTAPGEAGQGHDVDDPVDLDDVVPFGVFDPFDERAYP